MMLCCDIDQKDFKIKDYKESTDTIMFISKETYER